MQGIEKSVDSLAQEMGQTTFEEPDYVAKGMWLYKDFNTAWGNPFVATNEHMIDLTKKPPEGFTFMLRNDGAESALTVSCRDSADGGKTVSKQVKLPFTPVSKTVSVGPMTRIESKPDQRPSLRKPQNTDYFNAADRLQFDGESEDTKGVNEYLKNFNVFSYLGWRLKHYPVTDIRC